jgi:hypothetical protein
MQLRGKMPQKRVLLQQVAVLRGKSGATEPADDAAHVTASSIIIAQMF